MQGSWVYLKSQWDTRMQDSSCIYPVAPVHLWKRTLPGCISVLCMWGSAILGWASVESIETVTNDIGSTATGNLPQGGGEYTFWWLPAIDRTCAQYTRETLMGNAKAIWKNLRTSWSQGNAVLQLLLWFVFIPRMKWLGKYRKHAEVIMMTVIITTLFSVSFSALFLWIRTTISKYFTGN